MHSSTQHQSQLASYEVMLYESSHSKAWDQLVANSSMGTFLHTRRFLSYHGDRFQDQSLVLIEKNRIKGVFPAAVSLADDHIIVSHPGLSYGGLVHDGSITGERAISALHSVIEFYKLSTQFKKLVYKATPYIYHSQPYSDDLHALFRLGADHHRAGFSSTVDLAHPTKLSEARRAAHSVALRSDLIIKRSNQHLEGFWYILEQLLKSKYNTAPVHSLNEICQLIELFPENIELVTAWSGDEILAGTVLFNTPGVSHVQYMASNSEGHEANALTLILIECTNNAQSRGARYFDFGTSMMDDDRQLNPGLHQFKTSFGAGSVLYESFAIDLQTCQK